ncbi:unnamed protein product [Miscanthus lutarioriparius]|uniref:Uncharacterized protein n=1 Tax=Miscanthus lutarioriparius TaxID=422564 RepID=A0A811RHR7_9POAL|nr:unnamed protein product [Miscanthus lutarioriparius]
MSYYKLCVGHRCLVFHLACTDAILEALRRFLADYRVTFVGSGSTHNGRMLWEHYGLDMACGLESTLPPSWGTPPSVEQMAAGSSRTHCKPRDRRSVARPPVTPLSLRRPRRPASNTSYCKLCVGHRCLVFHLACADAIPEALRRFLADPRVTFVGSGSAHDGRMLWEHYGLDMACGLESTPPPSWGTPPSVEQMAAGSSGTHCKPRDVSARAMHSHKTIGMTMGLIRTMNRSSKSSTCFD